MDIYRACEIAKDRMANSVNGKWETRFTLNGPSGSKECKWLDPYFGFFQIEGGDGFNTIKQVPEDVDVFLMPETVERAVDD